MTTHYADTPLYKAMYALNTAHGAAVNLPGEHAAALAEEVLRLGRDLTGARTQLTCAQIYDNPEIDAIRDTIAEALYDNAHDGCDDDTGCTGGGLPHWQEFTTHVLMRVLAPAVAKLTRGRDQLHTALGEVLACFTDVSTCDDGTTHVRTGWTDPAHIEGWRAALTGGTDE